MTLGERIRARRVSLGLSMEAAARKSGMALGGYSLIERGVTKRPLANNLHAIAVALGTTRDALQETPAASRRRRA
jgi:transcriptional regulator with XRE-family HTH domain